MWKTRERAAAASWSVTREEDSRRDLSEAAAETKRCRWRRGRGGAGGTGHLPVKNAQVGADDVADHLDEGGVVFHKSTGISKDHQAALHVLPVHLSPLRQDAASFKGGDGDDGFYHKSAQDSVQRQHEAVFPRVLLSLDGNAATGPI